MSYAPQQHYDPAHGQRAHPQNVPSPHGVQLSELVMIEARLPTAMTNYDDVDPALGIQASQRNQHPEGVQSDEEDPSRSRKHSKAEEDEDDLSGPCFGYINQKDDCLTRVFKIAFSPILFPFYLIYRCCCWRSSHHHHQKNRNSDVNQSCCDGQDLIWWMCCNIFRPAPTINCGNGGGVAARSHQHCCGCMSCGNTCSTGCFCGNWCTTDSEQGGCFHNCCSSEKNCFNGCCSGVKKHFEGDCVKKTFDGCCENWCHNSCCDAKCLDNCCDINCCDNNDE